MRIAIISAVFPPEVIGGAEICAYDMAKYLSLRGHEVVVVTASAAAESQLANDAEFSVMPVQLPRMHGLYQHAEQSNFKKFIWHIQDNFDPRNVAILQSALSTIDPTHIIVHVASGIGFNSMEALRSFPVPKIIVVHDFGLICFRMSMFKRDHSCLQQCLECKIGGKLRLGHLDNISDLHFVFPSNAMKTNMLKYANMEELGQLHVINNIPDQIPDSDSIARPLNPKKLRFIYAGRLHNSKGVDIMLAALDNLSHDFDFELTILGKSTPEFDVQTLAKTRSWLNAPGFVDFAAVVWHMRNSDALLVPSVWQENYSRSVIQALSCGLPVIASNLGGLPEQITSGVNGLLVEAGNRDAWQDALSGLIRDPDVLVELKANAVRLKARYDADKSVDELEAFLSRLA